MVQFVLPIVQGPVAVSDSVSPTGVVLANNSIWTVTFDRQVYMTVDIV